MNRNSHFALPLLLIGLLAGCSTATSDKAPATAAKPAEKTVVTVYAAASTTNALDEIKAAFAKQANAEVQTNYAASSALAQQIENGAPADLFLSADQKWGDHVQSKAPALKRRDLLGNRLVIVVPADSQLKLAKIEDLTADDVKHLALGDPAAVPAGRYAKQALTKLNLWDKLKGKVVPAEDVRHALTYVETGAAEAGIVYATDAAISKRAKVAVEIPADLTDPVRYPLLLLKHAEGSKVAAALYDYLGSPDATAVFQKYGFVILANTAGEKK